jgi:hypothetical protein
VQTPDLSAAVQGETLFRTVIEVTGGGTGGGGGGGSTEAAVRGALESYMTRLPEPLNMVEVGFCTNTVCTWLCSSVCVTCMQSPCMQ